MFGLLTIFSGCSKDSESPVAPVDDNTITQPLDVFEQNKLLGRGINIGNALEAPNEGDWGVTIKEEFFQLIKSKGFNSVRLPIKWSNHALLTSPYTIDESFFQRIDQVVNQALSNGLAVVINIHHYDEIMTDPMGNRDRFLALWDQISSRYEKLPREVFFEVLNEPNGQLTPTLWNQYLKEAIQIIRKRNPYRTLIVSPANWSGVDNLSTLSLPSDDNGIIVTFHYYSPFQFTHQGAEWVDGSNAWLGTKWYGTPSEKSAVMADMDKAFTWSSTYNRPLYMGEFGAYNKADLDSRSRWTSFVSRAAEQKGFSFAYWEFCSGFGIYKPDSKEWLTQLLDALIPGA